MTFVYNFFQKCIREVEWSNKQKKFLDMVLNCKINYGEKIVKIWPVLFNYLNSSVILFSLKGFGHMLLKEIA